MKLMEILPEEEVKRACERFKRLQWDLLSRYLKCDIWLTREIDRRTEMISLSDPLSGQVPGVLAGPMARIIADRKEDERRRLEEENDKLQWVKRGLPGRFTKYLRMGRKQIIRETGSRILADELSGFVVENPYEICFAIYALIESGEDLPWLMASGSQVCETALHLLPWFTEGTEDEWATALMYNVNGWLSDEPPEEEIDFYHTMHQDRTLAQIVYELSRGIVPIGQHPFEKNRLELIREGMDERVARKVIDVAELLFLREFQSDAYKPFEWEEEAKDEEKDGVNGNPAMQQEMPDGSGGETPGAADISAEAAKDESGEEENNSAEELEKAKQEIKALRAALYKERRTANENLAKAEQELKALRLEHRELADLRELVFNRESENPQRLEKTRRQISYPYQTKKRTVVFGGHDSFLRTIKPMLPTVRFVDAGNLAFSPDIIRNADVVWIQNNCISHSQYWIIVKNCKLAGVQMRYFGFASAEKCVEQLVEWDEK